MSTDLGTVRNDDEDLGFIALYDNVCRLCDDTRASVGGTTVDDVDKFVVVRMYRTRLLPNFVVDDDDDDTE